MLNNSDNQLVVFKTKHVDSAINLDNLNTSIKSNLSKTFFTHYLECDYIANTKRTVLTKKDFYDNSFLKIMDKDFVFPGHIEEKLVTKSFVCNDLLSLETINNLINLIGNEMNFKEFVNTFYNLF